MRRSNPGLLNAAAAAVPVLARSLVDYSVFRGLDALASGSRSNPDEPPSPTAYPRLVGPGKEDGSGSLVYYVALAPLAPSLEPPVVAVTVGPHGTPEASKQWGHSPAWWGEAEAVVRAELARTGMPPGWSVDAQGVERSGPPEAQIVVVGRPGEGILVEGTTRADGPTVGAVLRQHSGRWSATLGKWFVQRSRDWEPGSYRLNKAHEIAAQIRGKGLPARAVVDRRGATSPAEAVAGIGERETERYEARVRRDLEEYRATLNDLVRRTGTEAIASDLARAGRGARDLRQKAVKLQERASLAAGKVRDEQLQREVGRLYNDVEATALAAHDELARRGYRRLTVADLPPHTPVASSWGGTRVVRRFGSSQDKVEIAQGKYGQPDTVEIGDLARILPDDTVEPFGYIRAGAPLPLAPAAQAGPPLVVSPEPAESPSPSRRGLLEADGQALVDDGRALLDRIGPVEGGSLAAEEFRQAADAYRGLTGRIGAEGRLRSAFTRLADAVERLQKLSLVRTPARTSERAERGDAIERLRHEVGEPLLARVRLLSTVRQPEEDAWLRATTPLRQGGWREMTDEDLAEAFHALLIAVEGLRRAVARLERKEPARTKRSSTRAPVDPRQERLFNPSHLREIGPGGAARCVACGATWPRDPALEVGCPVCRSPRGVPCNLASSSRRTRHSHATREQAAVAGGFMDPCGGWPTASNPWSPGYRAIHEAVDVEEAADPWGMEQRAFEVEGLVGRLARSPGLALDEAVEVLEDGTPRAVEAVARLAQGRTDPPWPTVAAAAGVVLQNPRSNPAPYPLPRLTRQPAEAIQFNTKREAIAGARSIGWLSKDATQIDVMGFRLWTIGDDHGNYVERRSFADAQRSRHNPAGYPGTGTVCTDPKGRQAPCDTKGATPSGELLYRPRLKSGSRPRIYLPAGAAYPQAGAALYKARGKVAGEKLPGFTRPPRGRRMTDALDGVAGRETTIYLTSASGFPERQPSQYRIVRADRLIPSHTWSTFAPHPDYPPGVQERQYHRDASEQAKVMRNAQGFRPDLVVTDNPDAANGPPVILPSGVVLGGNSRTMTIQRVYAELPDRAADLYRTLKERASIFGFLPSDVDQVRDPVLVRVVDPPDQSHGALRDLVKRYNEVLTQALDPTAAQVSAGIRITDAVIDRIALSIGPDETINDFLSSERSADTLVALQRSGLIDPRTWSAFIDRRKGLLNEDGRRMVVRAMLGRVLPDPGLLEALGPELRATLADGMAPILAAATVGGAPWNLIGPLTEAVRMYADKQAKVAEGKLEARNWRGYLAQHSLIAAPSQMAGVLFEVLHKRSGPRQFQAGARRFQGYAEQHPAGVGGLFGEAPDVVGYVRAAWDLDR